MAALSVKRSIEPSSLLSQCPIRTIDVVDVAMSRKIASVTFSRLDQVIIVIWGKILWCYHSNETFLMEFSHSAICFFKIVRKVVWNFCEFFCEISSQMLKDLMRHYDLHSCYICSWKEKRRHTLTQITYGDVGT